MTPQAVSAVAAVCSAVVATASAITAFMVARRTTLRVKRADIRVINDPTRRQNTRVLRFAELPDAVRQRYPANISVPQEHAAVVRVLFSNGGDADGFVAIDAAALRVVEHPEWRFSLDTQMIVPAHGFHIHDLVLRNLPVVPEPDVSVRVQFSWGGAGAAAVDAECTIPVRLFAMQPASQRTGTDAGR